MHFASQRRIKAIKMSKTLILIPSRMSATRLPGKPLLEIQGKSIISRVYSLAKDTNIYSDETIHPIELIAKSYKI